MIWVWALVAVAMLVGGAWIARAWVVSERKRKRLAEARQRAFDFSQDPMPPRSSETVHLVVGEHGMSIQRRTRERRDDPEPQRFGDDLEWPRPLPAATFSPDVTPAADPSPSPDVSVSND